jgi:hypothetical protein
MVGGMQMTMNVTATQEGSSGRGDRRTEFRQELFQIVQNVISKRRRNMKTKLFIMAAAISLASASQSRAQVLRTNQLAIYQPPPPPPVYVDTKGIIEWSSMASGCSLTGTATASVNVFGGSVTFNGTSFGDIFLSCPVSSLMGQVNAFGFAMRNDNGYVGGVNHCYADSAVMRQDKYTGVVSKLASPSTWNLSLLTGPHWITGALSTIVQESDLNNGLYWVVLHLNRDATLSCNPEADAAYLHYVIF